MSGMSNGHDRVRVLLHNLINPTSNEQYITDQKSLSDLFKEPGELCHTTLGVELLARSRMLNVGSRLFPPAPELCGRSVVVSTRAFDGVRHFRQRAEEQMAEQDVCRKGARNTQQHLTCLIYSLVPEARKPEVRQLLFSFLEEEDFAVRFSAHCH